MKSYITQQGLSLIEIMVALVLSSFLILGVTQIYIDNKRSYLFQQSQAENQEGSRYALLLLQQELAKAGYRRRPDQLFEAAFPASSAIDCQFNAGQTVTGNSDAVCIRYQPRSPQDRNCQGQLPRNADSLETPYTSSPEIIISRFYRANNALQCRSAHTNSAGIIIADTDTVGEMLSDLAGLRFQFGVGTAADARRTQQYTNTPNGPILSVRYAALLRSSSLNQRDATSVDDALNAWSTISGMPAADLTVLKAADRGQLYQVSQSTVMLRNLMP